MNLDIGKNYPSYKFNHFESGTTVSENLKYIKCASSPVSQFDMKLKMSYRSVVGNLRDIASNAERGWNEILQGFVN